MAWYIRKGIKIGPLLRLNLSKSGLGYSLGVKGARIGTGPRGNYIHVGRYGLYYRQSLPSLSHARATVGSFSPSTPHEFVHSDQRIPTVAASELNDESSQNILSEIRQKHQILKVAPIFAGASGLMLLLLLADEASFWLTGPVLLLGIAMTLALAQRDRGRKTAFLQFGFDEAMRAKYDCLSTALEDLASCSSIWRVWAREATENPKYSGGAGTVLTRRRATARLNSPPFIEADVQTWCLEVGDQCLYLFPDRILVYGQGNVGAVSYSALHVQVSATRFIEDSHVPPDSVVVDYSWQYTNRDGGPDRRFTNNRRIPVVQYAEIRIVSTTGVNILLHASNLQKATKFVKGVAGYISILNQSSATARENASNDAHVSSYSADQVGAQQNSANIGGETGTVFCCKCGARNPKTARFCTQCGKSLASPAGPRKSPPVFGN